MRQRNRLIINVLTNYGAFTVYGISNFVLVGYTVRKLGKDAFGIIALAMSLTVVTELLGRAVSQSLTKHLASEAAINNHDKANKYVNTSLVGLIAFSIVGFFVYAVLGNYISNIFNIPLSLVTEAKYAMYLMGLRVLLCFPLNTFQSVLWAYQRYDITNLIKSITVILRVLLVIVYFELVSAGVIELIAITIFTLILERILWMNYSFHVANYLRIKLSLISKNAFIVLASFGGFVVLINIANMIGYEAVKWVVGSELSVVDVGGYTLIATLAVFAGTMARSISTVLMPVASRYNALKQHDLNARIARLGTKYAMIVSSFLCLAPVFLLKPFLVLWVGKAYSMEYLSHLALAGIVLLFGQWVITTAICVLQMLTGVGKISFPAAVTISWAVCGLSILWVYLHWFGGSLLGVVIIITIARVLGSLIHLVYGIVILKVGTRRFLSEGILRPAVAGIAVCFITSWLIKLLDIYQLSQFIMAVIILSTLYGLSTWLISLSSYERNKITSWLKYFLNRTCLSNIKE